MIITQSAKDEILKNAKFLRIIATPGGCAGFQYELSYTNESGNNIVLEECIITDQVSKQFIDPITLDFVEELGRKEFVIANPNKKTCGCGNSFAA